MKLSSTTGFSLLEVVLSLALVSITFMTLLNAYFFIHRSYLSTLNATKGQLLLSEKLHEQMELEKTRRRTQGSFQKPFEHFTWSIKNKMASSLGFQDIKVQVEWPQPLGIGHVSIETRIQDPFYAKK